MSVIDLVGFGYVCVEDFVCGGDEFGVGDLCVVVIGLDFVLFVGVYFVECGFVGGGVVFDGDLCCYVVYGVNVLVVIGFDDEVCVGFYEGLGYVDLAVIGEYEFGLIMEGFDE